LPNPTTGSVKSILEDVDGTLWTATPGGLFRGKDGATTRFGRRDGFAHDSVFMIVDDQAGYLWLGLALSVARVSRKELDARAADPNAALNVVTFDTKDGLPSDESMGSYGVTGLRARDGRLWFVTSSGLAVFQAPEAGRAPPSPQVLIEEMTVNGRAALFPDVPTALDVPPGRGDLMFQFTAPSLVAPHRLRFATYLEGFDDGWAPASSRRTAQYTNIDPGRYTLRVAAFSDDRPDLRSEARMTIHLRPYFHQTPYFVVAMIVAISSVIVAIMWLRARQAQAMFGAILAERGRIALDLHDTLAQVFCAIGLRLDGLERKAEKEGPALREGLGQVRDIVDHGRRVARGVIWNLKDGPRKPGSLTAWMEELATAYEGTRVEVSGTGTPYALSPSAQSEIMYIAQQAISNAIEHGKASNIGIELIYEPGQFSMAVRDNGSGFEEQASTGTAGMHFGVAGMHERAVLAGGTLAIESSPGVGTEVLLVIDRQKAPGK
jgi:signal transduction histidine kinase